MRPLTDVLPKPLLPVRGKPLIEHHIERLVDSGIEHIVINLHWLGSKIEQHLGNGSDFDVNISYSYEEPVLETAGGIAKALPLLGDKPFLVVNGDIWTDFNFSNMSLMNNEYLAQLVMVDNPEHNRKGDFGLDTSSQTLLNGDGNTNSLTFSGIALYHPRFFSEVTPVKAPLAPLLKLAIEKGQICGIHHRGVWCDVGTPERLDKINGVTQ